MYIFQTKSYFLITLYWIVTFLITFEKFLTIFFFENVEQNKVESQRRLKYVICNLDAKIYLKN